MRQKIVFLIPGFRHKIGQKGYSLLRKTLVSEGFRVVPIAVPWKGSTITDNTTFFLKKYNEKLAKLSLLSKDVYLLGFSYGALVAFLAATKIPVRGLVLCSLSPFFKEDLPKTLPKNSSALQIIRHKTFASLYSNKLAKKIKAKSVCMLYGEKESTVLINRSKKTFRAIASKKKYLFSIQKTDHAISDKKYINAIQFATTFL
ncbi:MAG TPA: hypothetical protein VLB73_02710 [Patescibacteria group bacterium]|nr:hypothetical protein [Patescibacteria group bacterium]